MTEESGFKVENRYKKESEVERVGVRSPLADFSAKRKGDKLYIKPKNFYRINATPGVEEILNPMSEDEKEGSHQRSSTTIINDTAQVYTFVPGTKKTQESVPEEETSNNSFERMYNELKDSMMASTLDPKSFNKHMTPKEHFSTILTVSSSSEDETSRRSSEKNSLLESVTAFCSSCGKNTMTDVIENIYTGSL